MKIESPFIKQPNSPITVIIQSNRIRLLRIDIEDLNDGRVYAVVTGKKVLGFYCGLPAASDHYFNESEKATDCIEKEFENVG